MRVRSLLVLALTACLAASVLPAAPVMAAGRTFYVSTTGADAGAGTIGAPWRSMRIAFTRLRAGDTLYVRGGTYRENVGWGISKGTSTAPIRITGYQGERAVIAGSLQLVRANYWIVNRINVTRNTAEAPKEFLVKFSGGIGWQFLNAEVWGAKGVSNLMVNSTVAGEPASYRIAGNCIHDNDTTDDPWMNDHNIYLMPGYDSGPGIIERNILFNAENGNNIKAAGSNAGSGAASVRIRYNTMARAGQGIVVAYGSHHVNIYRNLIGPRRGGSSWYPAIRGYKVSGYGNSARDNAAVGFDKVLLSSDSSRPIRNGGGNRFVSPAFDRIGCKGFHPSNAVAQNYGRYA